MSSFDRFVVLYSVALLWRFGRDRSLLHSYCRQALSSRPPSRLNTLSVALQLALLGMLAAEGVGANHCVAICSSLAAACAAGYLRTVNDHPWIRRKANHIPWFLLLIAAGSWGPTPRSLAIFQLIVVQVYFSAGLQKLRRSGWTWANGETLRVHLWEHALTSQSPAARSLAARPRACAWLSTATLLFELSFPLCLIGPWLAVFYLGAAVIFHTASRVLLGVDYLRYFAPAYLSFVVRF